MARADIEGAAQRIAETYETDFGGKRRGRFTCSRDDLGDYLVVASVHDSTIGKLTELLLDDYDLCLILRHHSRFGVIHGRKVGAWRKVTRGTMSAYKRRQPPKAVPDAPEDEESDD